MASRASSHTAQLILFRSALQLADLYQIQLWVRALLDPAPIEKGPSDSKRPIAAPPPYIPLGDNPFFAPPVLDQNSGRVASPAKKASPRKRTTKAAAAAAASQLANAHSANDGGQAGSDDAGQAAADGRRGAEDDAMRVNVGSAVRTNGEVETRLTNVKVDMTAPLRSVALPESPEDMIAQAREMVADAREQANAKDSKEEGGPGQQRNEEAESRPARRE